MREIADTIQLWMLAGCSIAFVVLAAVVLVRLAYRAWCAWRIKPRSAVLAVMAVWALYVGGTKPPKASISWDEGLFDNGTAVDTNDLRRITFRWRYEAWIPPISTVTVSALPIGSSTTFEVASAPITNLTLAATMETDATNYTYLVAHSYTPEPVIKTNGVYHIECFGNTNRTWVPQGVVITKNGVPISYDPNAEPPPIDAAIKERILDELSEKGEQE